MIRHKKCFVLFVLFVLLVAQLSVFEFVSLVKAQTQGITRVQGLEKYPIVVTDTADYLRVNLTVFSVDFFKGSTGYNKLYNKTGDVLVYDDRIVLEYLSKAPDTWKQRGTPQSINWTVFDDYSCEVDRYYDDYLGTTYYVKYMLNSTHGSSSIKITVELTSGQADVYRLNWSPSGITIPDFISSNNSVTFGQGLGATTFDWNDVYQNFGNITTSSISTVANGKKAEICFNIGSLTVGQKVTVDPITRVQGNARGTSTTSPIPVTMASTPTSGNVEVAVIALHSYTSILRTVTSITQTGVTWTYQIRQANGVLGVEIWFGVVGSGASTSISISLSGTIYNGIADVCEYSGVATSSFLDKTATNTGSSKSPDTGTTATTTQADELWIGGTLLNTYAQTTPKNGFTLFDGVVYVYDSVAYLEKIVSATGTANSGTTGSGGSPWSGCIATFFATAGGATYTKTFTTDARLLKRQTKTATTDARLLKTLSKTLTADALLKYIKQKQFTTDGHLLKRQIKTFTSDAKLLKQLTKTFLADAIIALHRTKQFTADGKLLKRQAKTFSADAILEYLIEKGFTADGLLLKRQIKTLLADALLKYVKQKQFTTDALLLKRAVKTFSADAILEAVGTKGIDTDALLLKRMAKTFSADALLTEAQLKGFAVDGLLLKRITATFTADAILQSAILTKKTFKTDAILLKRQTATFTADAYLTTAPYVAPPPPISMAARRYENPCLLITADGHLLLNINMKKPQYILLD